VVGHDPRLGVVLTYSSLDRPTPSLFTHRERVIELTSTNDDDDNSFVFFSSSVIGAPISD
jgi:hypothetical protein